MLTWGERDADMGKHDAGGKRQPLSQHSLRARTLSTRPIQKAAFIVRVRDDPNGRLACDDITRAKDGTLTAVRPARGGLEALTDLEVAVKYSEFYGQAPV